MPFCLHLYFTRSKLWDRPAGCSERRTLTQPLCHPWVSNAARSSQSDWLQGSQTETVPPSTTCPHQLPARGPGRLHSFPSNAGTPTRHRPQYSSLWLPAAGSSPRWTRPQSRVWVVDLRLCWHTPTGTWDAEGPRPAQFSTGEPGQGAAGCELQGPWCFGGCAGITGTVQCASAHTGVNP